MKLPKRWLKYSRSGVIDSTRFVAFKVPLSQEMYQQLGQSVRFTPEDLILTYPDIRLVIDLTLCERYYNKRREFEDKQIEHVKILSRGRIVPTDEQFNKFERVVDDFTRRFPQHGLIGVHCTHGVNRTGYYICRYMIERMGFLPDEAMYTFQRSRGHGIERKKFTEDLKTRRMRVPGEGRERDRREESQEEWTLVRQRRHKRINDRARSGRRSS